MAGTFHLVDGKVSNVGQANGGLFIDFSRNGLRIFSAVIALSNPAQIEVLD